MSFEDLSLTDLTVKSIAELAAAGINAVDRVSIKPLVGDPDCRQVITKSDGTYELLELPTSPRNTTLQSIDQVPAYVNHAMDKWNADPAVYYTNTGAIAVLEESTIRPSRNGRASVKLSESKQLKTLRKFSENRDGAWIPHKAFVLLLRIDFEDCISPEQLDYLVRALGSLEFTDGSRTSSTVARNRESLGREVLSEVKTLNDLDIPEQVVLQVRLFTDPALQSRRQIVCKLETDPVKGQLALLPLANELENAMDKEMSDLGDMLRSSINSRPKLLTDAKDKTSAADQPPPRSFVPVFYGTP